MSITFTNQAAAQSPIVCHCKRSEAVPNAGLVADSFENRQASEHLLDASLGEQIRNETGVEHAVGIIEKTFLAPGDQHG